MFLIQNVIEDGRPRARKLLEVNVEPGDFPRTLSLPVSTLTVNSDQPVYLFIRSPAKDTEITCSGGQDDDIKPWCIASSCMECHDWNCCPPPPLHQN